MFPLFQLASIEWMDLLSRWALLTSFGSLGLLDRYIDDIFFGSPIAIIVEINGRLTKRSNLEVPNKIDADHYQYLFSK